MTGQSLTHLPKVLLHDHLDGGLRAQTLVELAVAAGYDGLFASDAGVLAKEMARAAKGSDLVGYLKSFQHTTAVMQSAEALYRVAYECVEDLVADGVRYAEVRFAPELHCLGGLDVDDVCAAVLSGFASAVKDAPVAIDVRGILCAMRNGTSSEAVARAAVRWCDSGVVGFDLAGPEAGFAPSLHQEAFDLVLAHNFYSTIHAGEAFGVASIHEALAKCGAARLGHGVRLIDDLYVKAASGNGRNQTTNSWSSTALVERLQRGEYIAADEVRLGRLAQAVLDRRVCLEICVSSNLHTGVVDRVEAHPVDLLMRLGFRVTLNTDNRLMSETTLSSELAICTRAFGWNLDVAEKLAMNAMKSAFCHHQERVTLMAELARSYAALRQAQ